MRRLLLACQQSVTVALHAAGPANRTPAGHPVRQRPVQIPLDMVQAVQQGRAFGNIKLEFLVIRLRLLLRVEAFDAKLGHQYVLSFG